MVERSDGSIWFTDPSYGIDSDYEGNKADSEIGACHVYRIDPDRARCASSPTTSSGPTAWRSPRDECSCTSSTPAREHIRLFDVTDDGTLTGGEVFAECDAGMFDGIRLDDAGRVWAAAHDGLHCFDPDGTLIGKLRVPEIVANLTFGGPQAQPPATSPRPARCTPFGSTSPAAATRASPPATEKILHTPSCSIAASADTMSDTS